MKDNRVLIPALVIANLLLASLSAYTRYQNRQLDKLALSGETKTNVVATVTGDSITNITLVLHLVQMRGQLRTNYNIEIMLP